LLGRKCGPPLRGGKDLRDGPKQGKKRNHKKKKRSEDSAKKSEKKKATIGTLKGKKEV